MQLKIVKLTEPVLLTNKIDQMFLYLKDLTMKLRSLK